MRTCSTASLALAALLLAGCGGSKEDGTAPDPCSACLYHPLVWADEFEGTGAPDPSSWRYDLAIGGPGTTFTDGAVPAASDYPLRMRVDWVRVYQ